MATTSSSVTAARHVIAWADIEPLNEVGRGSFGVVFKGKWKGKVVAVKVFKIAAAEIPFERARENLQREAGALEKASAPGVNDNIVKYHGVAGGVPTKAWLDKIGQLLVVDASSGSMIALVTRFEGGGNLRSLLHVFKPCVLTMLERLRILSEIAVGLFYLHRAEGEAIIHGDIKPENVLFSDKRDVRLADFGLSKVRQLVEGDNGGSRKSSIALGAGGGGGTWPYMAPELHKKIGGQKVEISRSTDMYSFGTLCWEVLTGLEPWKDCSEVERALAINAGQSLDLSKLLVDTPPSVKDMIASCLLPDSGRDARPSTRVAREVLDNAYDVFKGGRFSVFLSYCWGPSSVRQPLTQQVYAQLRDAGFRVWMDVCDMGHNLVSSMKEGIDNSECVVVLLSPDYVRSPNCRLELNHASDSGKPIIVCMVEPGFWKTWKDKDGKTALIDPAGELAVQWTKLEQRMYVDLAEASKVNWKDIDTMSEADKHKLTELPEAMPRLRQLLAELGVKPVASYKGAGNVASQDSSGSGSGSGQVPVGMFGVGGGKSVAIQESSPVPPPPRIAPAPAPVRAPASSYVYPPGPKARVTASEDAGPTLFNAAQSGKVDKVRELCSEWAGNGDVLNWKDRDGLTPLNTACVKDRHEVVSVLIGTAGVDLNMADDWGESPLWMSAIHGYTQSVRVLLSAKERGLDLNQIDEQGKTPLKIAQETNRAEVVALLVEAGALGLNSPPDPPPATPAPAPARAPVPADVQAIGQELLNAAQSGKVDKVKALCREWAGNGDVLNWRSSTGWTPLYGACRRNCHEVVSVLIGTAGVAINKADNDGYSPLWTAACYGNTQSVRVLISAKERGLDLNQCRRLVPARG